MRVSKVSIENYRATEKTDYIIDPEKTVIVGKNNTGKTSCFEFMRLALCNEGSLAFDDYPIFRRKELYGLLLDFLFKRISYAKLQKSISYPKITFEIDYSEDEDDANLEVLHLAIIDVDESVNCALVCMTLVLAGEENVTHLLDSVKGKIDEIDSQFKSGKISQEDADGKRLDIIRALIKSKFRSLFSPRSFSINPTNGEYRLLDVNISDIINARFVDAQRPIETAGEGAFNKVLKHFLKTKSSSLASVGNLEEQIDSKRDDFQREFNDHLRKILEEFYLNEYPNGSTETGVDVSLDIDLEQMVLDGASIYYKDPKANEKLPQKYNGLGYKNLLLMELEIAAFAFDTKEKTPNMPCLLFIEEPESHMHPQLQERFVEFINEFIGNLAQTESKRKCPIILSTHSSHIANIVDFSKIRYVIRENDKTVCKNLNDFAGLGKTVTEKKTHLDFLRKYLTLTKCDLFFADKVILVEGASERIYIPHCVGKLKELLGEKFHLDRQYYTILEIGGAYGYLFIPFVRFLNTPTLIITDLDSIGDDGKKCLVSMAKDTSNSTIRRWMKEEALYNQFSFDDVKGLPTDKKASGHVALAYQTMENGMIGRTLESAIKVANKDAFSITKEADLCDPVDKVKFALDLACNPTFQKCSIPEYIKQGLIWLNDEQ